VGAYREKGDGLPDCQNRSDATKNSQGWGCPVLTLLCALNVTIYIVQGRRRLLLRTLAVTRTEEEHGL
jgi:hypothetical protein